MKLEYIPYVLISVLVGLVIGAAFGFEVGSKANSFAYKAEAIKHDCAEYNNKTGAFQWKN